MTARHVLILVACGLSWGSTQALGKIAVSGGHGTFGLLFWQMTICMAVLGALIVLTRRRLVLTAPALRSGVIIALVGSVLPGITFFVSVAHLPAGIMSLLIATVPLMAFPMALALGMDRFSHLRMAGLACGILGVMVIALPGTGLPQAGQLGYLPLALCGPLCYAIEASFVQRTGLAGMDPVQALFLASAIGVAMVLPVALVRGEFIDPRLPWGRAETALVLESLVHAVIYPVYVWLAARAGSVFASQTSYLVTASGVLWAMLLLDESAPGGLWLALGLMLAGIALVQPRKTEVPA